MKNNRTCSNFISRIRVYISFIWITAPGFAAAQTGIKKSDTLAGRAIAEENFILLNGIEHWVTIKGDRSKPMILFLHGGPGSPMSPYSDNLYKNWEKDFLLVQWDQRGTGRTYGKIAPEELTPGFLKANPLSLEQMTNDGIALSAYLLKQFSKQKMILFGTSWGSVLGVKMATMQPGLFYAYVGHSQIVHPVVDLSLYDKIYTMAESENNPKALEVLNSIGKPPYNRANKMGKLFSVLKQFERAHSEPAPESWFTITPAYDNEADNKNRSDGDDYSFVNYCGDSVLGVPSMSAGINLLKDNVTFQIPVYLIQGSEDILTPKEKTKEYFDKITAPEKKYYLLPKTAHGFNVPVVETQFKIFAAIKLN